MGKMTYTGSKTVEKYTLYTCRFTQWSRICFTWENDRYVITIWAVRGERRGESFYERGQWTRTENAVFQTGTIYDVRHTFRPYLFSFFNQSRRNRNDEIREANYRRGRLRRRKNDRQTSGAIMPTYIRT